jgi:hypothetical protein
MPNQPKTPKQTFRMDGYEWAEFGSDAAQMGTDRSELLRQFAAWWMRKPGARLPSRPPREA